MMMLLSQYLKLGSRFEASGVFDLILNYDSNYFININRIKYTRVKEFESAYNTINNYFTQIAILLKHSKNKNDIFYKKALESFKFPEVNGIGLGYSKGRGGSGFGKELTQRIIEDAKQIVDAGTEDPEIFYLVGMFEDKVGPDRLSDMFAGLLENEIIKYSRRIYEEFNINESRYPEMKFKNGFLINPYRDTEILLVPRDIIHELPIAKDFDDIDRVCTEIEKIKKDINDLIGEKWSKVTSSYKKSYIRESIIKNKSILDKLIKEFKECKIDEFDFTNEFAGIILGEKIISDIGKEFLITKEKGKNTLDITIHICNKFKGLIENRKGYQILYDDNNNPRKEKIAQQLFLCVADSYCNANDLDLSPECNNGRGPVDFKTSKGRKNKTLVEIKLTTNIQLLHGFQKQLGEYSKSEETNNLIYLVIDNGGSEKRLKELTELYNSKKDISSIRIILVDAKPKESASRY